MENGESEPGAETAALLSADQVRGTGPQKTWIAGW